MKTTAVKPMNCEFATEGLLWIDKIATGVGIILFSSRHKVAAGIHVLRGNSQGKSVENPAYYVDTAIEYVVKEFKKKDALNGLSIAVAGGASLMSSPEKEKTGSNLIGIVKEVLARQNLSVKIERVGGTKLRTMVLNIDEGKIKIS